MGLRTAVGLQSAGTAVGLRCEVARPDADVRGVRGDGVAHGEPPPELERRLHGAFRDWIPVLKDRSLRSLKEQRPFTER